MKKFVLAILAILILLAGLSLILYPTLSDYYNRIHQSGAIVDYAEKINGFDDETFKQMWDEAVLYNEQLFNLTRGIETPESEKLDYYEVLNVTNNGMMSYIDIPSINCHLPLCHGCPLAVKTPTALSPGTRDFRAQSFLLILMRCMKAISSRSAPSALC